MAQDDDRKNEASDLVAQFRRVAAQVDFDAPAPAVNAPALTGSTTSHGSATPPPLPTDLPPMPGPDHPGHKLPDFALPRASASSQSGGGPGARLPPALPMSAGSAALDLKLTPPPLQPPPPLDLPPPARFQTEKATDAAAFDDAAPESEVEETGSKGERRAAKRRAAMPSREQIAANDDAPSIGGLIYALNQKPSRKPFTIATFASLGWAAATLGYAAYYWGQEIVAGAGFWAFLGRPELLTLIATLLGPVGLMFALAVIAYRAEEMRLRSSAMTEVAVRLAEPDRMAEQSVASLGQAVRRQVSFMNDAVTRALGRAGELEALVHSEVAALERSYSDNERKIRTLIQSLASERDALVTTGDRVSGTLRSMGDEVPELIEKLSQQQIKLAKIIEGANSNLGQLESAMATQTGQLETAVETRAVRLQEVLGEYTQALSSSLDQRMEQIGSTIANRTGDLQIVFEEYTKALDVTLDNRTGSIGQQLEHHTGRMDERLSQHAATFIERTEALDAQLGQHTRAFDNQLIERTQALDAAFNERLRLFDDAILRTTASIDSSIGEKTVALTSALDTHAKSLGDTLSRQTLELDESLLQGINAVRRTSENITRQSIKALEGLAGQSELLQKVSENLLGQINTITNRFDNQSQQIIRSANALETANYKIDKTLQARQVELNDTLDRMSGKAEQLSVAAQGYTRQIEGSLTEAELRARQLTTDLVKSTEERSRSTIADIERLQTAATDTTTRALDDLRSRFSNVSTEVTQGLTSLTSHVTESTGEARRRAAEAANQLAAEQERLRAQAQSLPDTTRESADAMRRVLQDHLRAIDELSTLSRREATARDVTRPLPPSAEPPPRPLVSLPSPPPPREDQNRTINSLSSVLSQELQSRSRPPQQQPAAPQMAPPVYQQPTADAREGWSLGDLLKRASEDDDNAHHGARAAQHVQAAQALTAAQSQAAAQAQAASHAHAHAAAQAHATAQMQMAQQPGGQGYGASDHDNGQRSGLDFAVAARALDPATATAIWQRLGSGQRGIMVRSIYTPEGRLLFDETVMRLQREAQFGETTAQYLADFERVLQEADRQDPSGGAAQQHLRSDYGRVYLFLAHASGRIA